MKRFIAFLLLILAATSLSGCRLFGNYGDGTPPPDAATVLGFSQQEKQEILAIAQSEQANLSLPAEVPAVSFYRFDIKNEVGAKRLATIISYADAIATPTYGPESTAKVYLYEAKKRQLGYEFDYFNFEKNIPVAVVNKIVDLMVKHLSDPNFLLHSRQHLDEIAEIADAVKEEAQKLPIPVQSEFKATNVATTPIDIDLKPRFTSLGATALSRLIFNTEMRNIFTKLQEQGIENSPLISSNVNMKKAGTSVRANYLKNSNKNISQEDRLVLANYLGVSPSILASPRSYQYLLKNHKIEVGYNLSKTPEISDYHISWSTSGSDKVNLGINFESLSRLLLPVNKTIFKTIGRVYVDSYRTCSQITYAKRVAQSDNKPYTYSVENIEAKSIRITVKDDLGFSRSEIIPLSGNSIFLNMEDLGPFSSDSSPELRFELVENSNNTKLQEILETQKAELASQTDWERFKVAKQHKNPPFEGYSKYFDKSTFSEKDLNTPFIASLSISNSWANYYEKHKVFKTIPITLLEAIQQQVEVLGTNPLAITLSGKSLTGKSLTYTVVETPKLGTLSAITGQTITYTPNNSVNNTDYFTFKVSDENGESQPATISITLKRLITVPEANSQNLAINEDETKNITLSGQAPEGKTLNFTILSQPTNGVLSGTAPDLTYKPNKNFFGNDSFTFKTNDGQQQSEIATVSIQVKSVYDQPKFGNDGKLSITGLSSDSVKLSWADIIAPDSDSDKLEIKVQYSDNNSFIGDWPLIEIDSKSNSFTIASLSVGTKYYFRVIAFDMPKGWGFSNTTSFTIGQDNQKPISANASVTTDEDTPYTTKISDFHFQDSDSSDSLVKIKVLSIDTLPEGATLRLDGNNLTADQEITQSQLDSIVLTPVANQSGNPYAQFTYQVSDGKDWSQSYAFKFKVNAVNDIPVITSHSGNSSVSVSFDEINTSSAVTQNTPVATISATDIDSDQTISYSITGGTDAARFVVNSSTGVLTFNIQPDFDNPIDTDSNNTYHVQITASDNNGGSAIQSFVVNINNLPELPVITSNGGNNTANITIPENTTSVTTVEAENPEVGQTVSYSISGGSDQAKFSINSSSGALTFASAPNFESPTDSDSNNTYQVEVTADDSVDGTDTQMITVTVTNANESPVITNNSAVSLPENQTAAMTVTATDPDAGANITFNITGGNDQAKFAINSSSGALTFNSAPDYETPTDGGSNNTYEVEVTASDGNSGSNAKTFNITVTNINESPSITSGASFNVVENTTAVTTVTATDQDAGQNITFNISGGADQAKLSINSSTGALTFNSAPDYEYPTDSDSNNTYEVEVTANDGNGKTDSKAITVTVTDISDNNDPQINSNGGGDTASITLAENISRVTTVTATDPDAGANITYSLSGTDADVFFIDPAGAIDFMEVAGNYENPRDANSDNIYNFTVTASDGLGGTDSQAITLTVTDLASPKIKTVKVSKDDWNEDIYGNRVGDRLSIEFDMDMNASTFINGSRLDELLQFSNGLTDGNQFSLDTISTNWRSNRILDITITAEGGGNTIEARADEKVNFASNNSEAFKSAGGELVDGTTTGSPIDVTPTPKIIGVAVNSSAGNGNATFGDAAGDVLRLTFSEPMDQSIIPTANELEQIIKFDGGDLTPVFDGSVTVSWQSPTELIATTGSVCSNSVIAGPTRSLYEHNSITNHPKDTKFDSKLNKYLGLEELMVTSY